MRFLACFHMLLLLLLLLGNVQGFLGGEAAFPFLGRIREEASSTNSLATLATTTVAAAATKNGPLRQQQDRQRRWGQRSQRILHAVGGPTELPDSLDDAALRAAEASVAFAEMAGPLARCRVDFDPRAGDETFPLLQESAEFVRGLVSGLSVALVPGVAERQRSDLQRLGQARAELQQVEAELQSLLDNLEIENSDNSNDNSNPAIRDLQEREDALVQLIERKGRLDASDDPWKGPTVCVYFPDEGNAALARRDWSSQVPACVRFAASGGIQSKTTDVSNDVLVVFHCPRAAESDDVEAVLQKHELESPNLKLSVFVNPNLVDMGVTGFGLAGRMLRERLIDPLTPTYLLKTLEWGALTRQWPNLYTVWQEDSNASGGYKLLQALERWPSNPELVDLYERDGSVRSDEDGGPNVLNQLGDFINGMMRL